MGRLTLVLVLAVVVLGAGVYVTFRHVPAILGQTGCTAGAGHAAVALDSQQAQIAATIAGVAHHRGMPSRALTVAYATAMQETHLHDPDYGDLDSVGVFQQRPSEGWGPASKLVDPVYASTRFFRALAQVPGYQQMPVYKAAQAVQHSEAHPRPPGDRQGVRAARRQPIRLRRRRTVPAGPGPTAQPGLGGGRLAGDPCGEVPAARRALCGLPLARAVGPHRMGQGPGWSRRVGVR